MNIESKEAIGKAHVFRYQEGQFLWTWRKSIGKVGSIAHPIEAIMSDPCVLPRHALAVID